MKAAVWTRYGPPEVLTVQDVPQPAPKADEVRIKVRAATVLIADCELRDIPHTLGLGLGQALRLYYGWNRPTRVTILGQELAGDVDAAGQRVTQCKTGDPVFAHTFLRLGAHAEYVCVPAAYAVRKPAHLSYEQAATLPTGGIYGWHLVKVGGVRAGQRILLNGAGGSIGTYALQIAKYLGAEVTAVDSGEKLDMLRAVGADHVIDYTRQDFTRLGQTFDVIIDIVGKSHFSRSLQTLTPHGVYVLGNPSLAATLQALLPPGGGKQVVTEAATYKAEYYAGLIALISAGNVTPVIDRRYPLEQIVAAHRYVGEGHKQGNVVITVSGE